MSNVGSYSIAGPQRIDEHAMLSKTGEGANILIIIGESISRQGPLSSGSVCLAGAVLCHVAVRKRNAAASNGAIAATYARCMSSVR